MVINPFINLTVMDLSRYNDNILALFQMDQLSPI